MNKTALLAAMTAALVASATPPALAYSPVTCVASLLQVVCTPHVTAPDARTIVISPLGYKDPDVSDADRASWAERCKPRKVVIEHAERWVYAAPDCADGPRAGDAR